MLFFPYKVDLDLRRIPFVTFLVCILCVGIYYLQVKSNLAVNKAAIQFCANSLEGSFGFILKKVTGSAGIEECVNLISVIHSTSRPDNMILTLATNAEVVGSLKKSDSIEFLVQSIGDLYATFEATAPQSLTAQLMYDPHSFKLSTMLSAAFSHGGWMHLIGNLFFFFAFAASVEILIGSLFFGGTIIFLALTTNLTYSFVMMNNELALPTLGLSGVVMGMIGLFTFMLPTAKIRCFFWYIIIVRILSIPAWILALWYIGWDIFHLYSDSGQSSINLVAHVSGAVIGVLLGLILFRQYRPTIRKSKTLRRGI